MSTPRYCEFWKASNGKWYLNLAVHEERYDDDDYDDDDWRRNSGNETDGTYEDSVTYGPFDSEAACEAYLRNFSNPGSFYTDSSGKNPPPTKSPNGSPVVSPRRSWGGDYGSVTKSPSMSTPGSSAPEPKPTAGKTYKVYGKKKIKPPYSNYKEPVAVPVHTRVKGKAYGPLTKTRFKKDDQVTVVTPKNASFAIGRARDGKTPKQIVVNDPEFNGANQTWTLDDNDVKESLLKTFIIESLKHVR